MLRSLKPGLKFEFSYLVPQERTVPHLLPEAEEFQKMPQVLATGFMVGLFEWACIRAINPYLDWPQEQSVGIGVDLSHEAATPPGLTVLVSGELRQVQGRKLTFYLEGHDGVEIIARGGHERFIINAAQFRQKAKDKQEAALSQGILGP